MVTSQLLTTLQDIMNYYDKKNQIDIAVLDFAKGFDTVPHNRLLGKLPHYGVNNNLPSKERVSVVGRAHSHEVLVESGVPQGTVLGPLLFLTYINDLLDKVSSSVRFFADDPILYRAIKTTEDQDTLQQDLFSLEKCFQVWGMRFNTTKCEIMRSQRSLT